ncbi:MAG TPA: MucR family transcriptional regulator, partial [Ignavibacteriaceae bacterium]|nr:MucR family transcriptional regulator [Ignavibacteriaceae bacterium]
KFSCLNLTPFLEQILKPLKGRNIMSEYPHPFFDENGKIFCQECGKTYLVMSPRHIQKHDMSFKEYRDKYPEAPVSSKEFDSKSKYGKEKQIFAKQILDEFDNYEKIEEVEVFEDPDVNELAIDEIYSDEAGSTDICDTSKNKILDHLRYFFTDIKKDYTIAIHSPTQHLLFETISDFADPYNKINIEFPKCFWHNQDEYTLENRKRILEQYGWKVIIVKSHAPTFKIIRTTLEAANMFKT